MKLFACDMRRWPQTKPDIDASAGRVHPGAEAGFTLMELIATIVITGLLAGFAASMLVSGVETYDYLNERKDALQDSRVALQRIVKEVRQAVDPGMIQRAAADSLRFLNVDSLSVQVRYVNQSILLNGQMLVEGVTQFNLVYFDGAGTQLAFPINNTGAVWRIRVAFVYSGNGQSISLQQDIVPRNFRN